MNRRKFLTTAATVTLGTAVAGAATFAAINAATANAHIHLFTYHGGTQCWCGAIKSNHDQPVNLESVESDTRETLPDGTWERIARLTYERVGSNT